MSVTATLVKLKLLSGRFGHRVVFTGRGGARKRHVEDVIEQIGDVIETDPETAERMLAEEQAELVTV